MRRMKVDVYLLYLAKIETDFNATWLTLSGFTLLNFCYTSSYSDLLYKKAYNRSTSTRYVHGRPVAGEATWNKQHSCSNLTSRNHLIGLYFRSSDMHKFGC